MNCKVCGVRTAQDWTNGTCIHCDWFLGEGYTEEEIREKLIRAKKDTDRYPPSSKEDKFA